MTLWQKIMRQKNIPMRKGRYESQCLLIDAAGQDSGKGQDIMAGQTKYSYRGTFWEKMKGREERKLHKRKEKTSRVYMRVYVSLWKTCRAKGKKQRRRKRRQKEGWRTKSVFTFFLSAELEDGCFSHFFFSKQRSLITSQEKRVQGMEAINWSKTGQGFVNRKLQEHNCIVIFSFYSGEKAWHAGHAWAQREVKEREKWWV